MTDAVGLESIKELKIPMSERESHRFCKLATVDHHKAQWCRIKSMIHKFSNIAMEMAKQTWVTFTKLTSIRTPKRHHPYLRSVIIGSLKETTTAKKKSLYISLPFSAKQQREITKFCVFWRTQASTANILDFLTELIAGITYLVWVGFWADLRSKRV